MSCAIGLLGRPASECWRLTEAGFPNGIDLTLNSPDERYLKDKEVSEAIARPSFWRSS